MHIIEKALVIPKIDYLDTINGKFPNPRQKILAAPKLKRKKKKKKKSLLGIHHSSMLGLPCSALNLVVAPGDLLLVPGTGRILSASHLPWGP